MDTIAPLIADCPADQTITYESAPQGVAIIWNEPHATDMSGETTLIRRSHQPGQLFREGSTTVNYTFSDPSGNEAVCEFDIIVYAGENAECGFVEE